jgi:protoheme IX farnesyltransferase
MTALSAGASGALASPVLAKEIVIVSAGVFLAACGACGLNQYQERTVDGQMERTRLRPLPSGTISPGAALPLSVSLLVTGMVCVLLWGGLVPASLVLLTALWYNGIYTALKRRTAFAAVPGALIGAMPPAIGWSAAGGDLRDPALGALCLFFFLWQVPHFWSLMLGRGSDYEQAGLPSLQRTLSDRQIARLILSWSLALAVSSLAFPVFGIVETRVFAAALVLTAPWPVASALALAGGPIPRHRRTMQQTNWYLLIVLLLLIGDRLWLKGHQVISQEVVLHAGEIARNMP